MKRKEINAVQKDITAKKTASKGADKCEDLLAQKGKLETELKKLEDESAVLQDNRDKKL